MRPIETLRISNADLSDTLRLIDEKLKGGLAAVFTISYDFGSKLAGIGRYSSTAATTADEPEVFMALFENLIVHDYSSGETFVTGNPEHFGTINSSTRVRSAVRRNSTDNRRLHRILVRANIFAPLTRSKRRYVEATLTRPISRSRFLSTLTPRCCRVRFSKGYGNNIRRRLRHIWIGATRPLFQRRPNAFSA